jgi:hypothetical protein
LKTTGRLLFALFLSLLGLGGVIQSLTFKYWDAMVLPLTMSGLILVLALIETIRELRGGNNRNAVTNRSFRGESLKAVFSHRAVQLFGWVIALVSGIYLFGFLIMMPLFTFSFLKSHHKGWVPSLLYAIGLLALVFGIFEITLDVPLYRGWIFKR